ncbi:putative cell survival pathways protein [Kappamyces sp. JEL0829]|nr:putative cell survival pathways protein [Kappamyces sp. JEL0829]
MKSVATPIHDFSVWKLKDSSSCTHSKTFYIILKDKTFLLFQCVYSTMNSWSHSVQCTLRVYPGSSAGPSRVGKTVGLGAHDFRLGKDSLSVDTGALRLDCIDGGKQYGLFYKDEESGLSLQATVTVASVGSFVIDQGKSCGLTTGMFSFKDSAPDNGWVKSSFIPKATCSGTFEIKGQKTVFEDGLACGIDANVFHPQNVLQWNFVNLQNDTDSLMLYQCTVAEKNVCQASLTIDNKLVAILVENKLVFYDAEVDDFCGYKVPKKITHKLTGKTVGGEPITISLELPLKNLIDKVDVLAELPYLVRIFIQTFVTAPYCYQWIDVGTARVEIGGTVREITGLTFNETSFLASHDHSG